MRHNKDYSISAALATATCSLLGTGLPTAVDAQEEPTWDINTSALFYGEDKNRVKDYSVKTIVSRLFSDERILSLSTRCFLSLTARRVTQLVELPRRVLTDPRMNICLKADPTIAPSIVCTRKRNITWAAKCLMPLTVT